MKRTGVLLLLAVLLAGTCVYAQTNQVLSRNAVGYVRLVCPKGKFVLARVDFEPLNSLVLPPDVHSEDVFGSQLPLGTTIYAYNNVKGSYDQDNLTFGGWDTNIVYDRGMGFWIAVPESAASNEYVAYLMGEVPDRFTAPTTVVAVAQGYTQLGYGYPAAVLWTATDLAVHADIGDTLYTFNGTNYVPNNLTFGGWDDPNMVIYPGEGFWFVTAKLATNWFEIKPFTWP
jgi:hypothetical protein